MSTTFVDEVYTPLDRAAAKAVVAELDALVDRYESGPYEDGGSDGPVPAELGGLSVITAADLRDLESEDGDASISDDFAISVAAAPPPSPEEAEARGKETRFTLDFDSRALERLPSCRTTIRVEYAARIATRPIVVTVFRTLFARVGRSVVLTAEGSQLVLSEAYAATFVGARGVKSLDEPPRARQKPQKKVEPRAAKAGELESVKLRERLDQQIHDPFVAPRLQAALRATTVAVQQYAAALIQDGAQADTRAAKTLGSSVAEIAEARDELDQLLAKCARSKGGP